MYLVDTNIWLERLLNQSKSDEVGRFLGSVAADRLAMTDFALHSLSIILVRLDRTENLLRFVEDTVVQGDVRLVRLNPEDISRLIQVSKEWKLDFDDAYQYVAAELHNLTLVSFDSDFDRTGRGRRTPSDLLKE